VIVVDASVLANAIADDQADGNAARDAIRQHGGVSAPDLVDVETVAVLRKRWLAGTLPAGGSRPRCAISRSWRSSGTRRGC